MYLAGHPYSPMSDADVDLIHQGALRILDQMGMEIQNRSLLEWLADLGLPVDLHDERVRFPSRFVERFIAEADKHDWERIVPRVGSSADVYHGRFHDPASGELVPWSEESFAYYVTLARCLPHVDSTTMLGCQIPVPPPLEPLYERYYCWKYGAREGGSIYSDELCPFLLELYERLADERGLPLQQVFRGNVYLVPPLKLGRYEAYQLLYFQERGLRVRIGGGMGTMGSTAPVTLAGAVTLNLAEQLALRILEWALYGEKRLHLGVAVSVMDMRSGNRRIGRPELALANLLMAQMARHYGASFGGHGGLADAKLPSAEAGVQKALSAIPILLAGGSVWLYAGLLSMDEISSPIQMVLDNEFLGGLKRFTHAFEINAETIGLDTIIAVGPGGHYLDKDHTVRHFRDEHWQPSIWSRQMLNPWLANGRDIDADRARDIALQIRSEVGKAGSETFLMSEGLERDVMRIIEQARQTLIT